MALDEQQVDMVMAIATAASGIVLGGLFHQVKLVEKSARMTAAEDGADAITAEKFASIVAHTTVRLVIEMTEGVLQKGADTAMVLGASSGSDDVGRQLAPLVTEYARAQVDRMVEQASKDPATRAKLDRLAEQYAKEQDELMKRARKEGDS